MTVLIGAVRKFTRDETGASMAEYGLLLGLISVVCVGVLNALGTSISSLLASIASTV